MKSAVLSEYIERRIERVPFSGCWLWTGTTVDTGYGQICIEGRYKRAHRVVYEMHVGTIPEGLYVLHRCDVPCCVNPAHLYVGTQLQNIRDCLERGRFRAGWHNAAKTYCSRGHEFNEVNTGATPGGYRFCKACSRITQARYLRAKA